MKKLRKPQVNGRRFRNHVQEGGFGFFLRSLQIIYQYYFLEHKPNIDKTIAHWIGESCPLSCSVDPVITWIGHATCLIQVGGCNILTDPIFGNLSIIHRRILPPGISLDKLPKIDFILISHNHIDHMDSNSLLAIQRRFPNATVLVPKGDKTWFDRRGFAACYEHTWWEQRSFLVRKESDAHITFSFLPTAHWSGRGFFDKDKSLWGSWMIEYGDHHIYFAGDTCFSDHFDEIAKEFPCVDIGLLPIGPGEPRELLKHGHMDYQEAGSSFLVLGAKHLVPMHWGTFSYYGVEHFDSPINHMQHWWLQHADKLIGKQLHCAKVGQTIAFGSNDVKLKNA